MSNQQIALNFLRAWERYDKQEIAAYLTDDYVLTGPAPVPLDKNAFAVFHDVLLTALPDWKFNEYDIVENGDTVRMNVAITGTHQAVYDLGKLGLPIPPVPATGKRIALPRGEVFEFHMRDGKVARLDITTLPDGGVIGILAQMGVQVPQMG